MSFNKRILLSVLFSLMLWQASCSPPSTIQSTSTREIATTDSPQIPQSTMTKTLAGDDVRLTPDLFPDISQYLVGEPIPFFEAGQSFTISYIGNGGWAIGAQEGESDHIVKRVSLDLWTDVTPPEPNPLPGAPYKVADGFFLEAEKAWISYSTGPGTGQSHVVIWRMVDRFPRVSWAPSIIQTRGTIGSIELYFLDEDHGWALIFFDEGGMSKQYVAMYATKDGGATWEFLFDPMEGTEVQACTKTGLVFEDPERGWLTRACRGLYDAVFIDLTTDGGLSWEMVHLPPPSTSPDLFSNQGYCDLYSPQFFPPDELVFVVECLTQFDPAVYERYLYSTKDGGTSWTTLPLPERELYFITRFIAYSVGRDIYKTENGGVEWSRVRAVNWDGQFNFRNEDRAAAVARNKDEIAYVETYDGLQTFIEGSPTIHPSQDPRESDE